MATEQELLDFITKARKRGFSDFQIKKSLISNNWPEKIVDRAFQSFAPKEKLPKNQICIFLSDDILSQLEKRAKKNMMNLQEQIEDILRRSCTAGKTSSLSSQEKLDDMFISYFSRKR